ncbi:MAG: hypothetical protein JSR39_09600, partial [Verrucomicrobia bacterium]|nr:hypothetical protein [Verrucomicrobiota bacterium]
MASQVLSRLTSQIRFDDLQYLKSYTPTWTKAAVLTFAIPNPPLEPFEFPSGRHPLAMIADMIEKMRSGTISFADAQRYVVQLDPASRVLFHDHESTLIENPAQFFNLFMMADSMMKGRIPEDKTAVLQAFNSLGTPLRNALAGKIYHFSTDPTKGSCERWGEI